MYLLITIISLFSTGWMIVFFPPSHQMRILNFNFSIFYPFFFSIFLSLYFFLNFLTSNKRLSFFATLFVIVYLLFRLNGLTEPLFIILLIALFLTLEFLFSGRGGKNRKNRKEESLNEAKGVKRSES